MFKALGVADPAKSTTARPEKKKEKAIGLNGRETVLREAAQPRAVSENGNNEDTSSADKSHQ